MLDGTVDARDALAEQRADRELHLPGRTGRELVIRLELVDRERALEDLLVAAQSLEGSSVLEHEMGVNRFGHAVLRIW